MALIRPFISRILARVLPSHAQRTFNIAALGVGASLVAEFDVVTAVADFNQLLTGAFPGGSRPQTAIGPLLDALLFASGPTTIGVEYAVDQSCAYHFIVPATAVAASTPVNISGLRITGRFVRVTLTNADVAPIAAEFGVYVRSS